MNRWSKNVGTKDCILRQKENHVTLCVGVCEDPPAHSFLEGTGLSMNLMVGDIIKMKKPHPCGSKEWELLRVGMDFRMKCCGCGHTVMLARVQAEKNVRGVVRDGKVLTLEEVKNPGTAGKAKMPEAGDGE